MLTKTLSPFFRPVGAAFHRRPPSPAPIRVIRVIRAIRGFSLLLCSAAAVSGAEVSVVYEGCLRNDDATPLATGTNAAVVALYETASSTDPLWARHYDLVLNDEGLFRIDLTDRATPVKDGPTNTLAAVLRGLSGSSVYLGIKLDAEKEAVAMRPRLLAVPFALAADDAIGAQGAFAVGKASTFGGFATDQSSSRVDFSDGLTVGAGLTFTAGGSVGSTKFSLTHDLAVQGKAVYETPLTAGGGVKLVGGVFTASEDLTVQTEAKVGSLEVIRQEGTSASAAVRVNGANGCVPFGTVILWYGKEGEIPADWAVCDGSTIVNSIGTKVVTPNLQDRFPVGSGESALQAGKASDGAAPYPYDGEGGEATHTLTASEIPNHAHRCRVGWYGRAAIESANYAEHVTMKDGSRVDGYKHGVDDKFSTWTGGGKGHENLPQHRILLYIMKVE